MGVTCATRQASSFTHLPRKLGVPGCGGSQPPPLQASAPSGPSLLPSRACAQLSGLRRAPSRCLSSCLKFPATRLAVRVPLSFRPSCQPMLSLQGCSPVSRLRWSSVADGVALAPCHLTIPVASRVCILPSSWSSLIVTWSFGGCLRSTLTLNWSSGGLLGRCVCFLVPRPWAVAQNGASIPSANNLRRT